MTATVRIITGTRRDVLRIPNEAIRFTPPSGVRTTAPAERPNRDDAIIAYLSEKLSLTDEQAEQFGSAMAAARRDREQRTSAPRGEEADEQDDTSTEVSARRSVRTRTVANGEAQRRGRITRILEGILTVEQMEAYQALRDEWRETTRPANVWTETPDGLQPHRLLLGLSDDAFSEVLRGELEQGDRVVTRARRNGGSDSQGGGRGGR
jgi:HlyD family secretion protein